MRARHLLLLALTACTPPRAEQPTPAEAKAALLQRIDGALARSARWMLAQQSDDGAFRSEAYSAFRDGRALTPVVLSALLFASPEPGLAEAHAKGSDFIAGLVGADGALDPGPYGLDYPVYSLSGAILVLSLPSNARHGAAKAALLEALSARQLREPLGWTPQDLAYGGWGYYRDLPRRPDPRGPVPATARTAGVSAEAGSRSRPKPGPPDSGRSAPCAPPACSDPPRSNELLTSNLASTLFAAGALALGGVALDDPRLLAARTFVERSQNFAAGRAPGELDDGGFFFTPHSEVANKAGREEGRFRSYGTATADGLRLLLRLGVPRSDPRVKAAAEWLFAHFDPERVPGHYPPDREVQRASSYYYWAWTSAHALALLGPMSAGDSRSARWAERLAEALLTRQAADGTWRSTAVDMREDDPLVATPLAASALAIARMTIEGRYRMALPQ